MKEPHLTWSEWSVRLSKAKMGSEDVGMGTQGREGVNLFGGT